MSGDIDFDELDKAVNSLMKGVGKEAQDEPKPKVLTISSTLQPDEKPPYVKLDEAAKAIGNETVSNESEKVVTFIDDASKPQAVNASPETPVHEEEATPNPPEPVPTEKPAPVPRPSGGRFMDVVHPSSDMRVTNAPPSPVPEPLETQSVTGVPEGSVAANPATDAPLTPFLPDAKVEKRPLGGAGAVPSPFDDEEPANVEETIMINSEKPPKTPETDEQPVLDASTFEAASPAESAEVIAVESEAVPETSPADASLQTIESGDTEKLSTMRDDDKTGTIYDVANQPQPLAHPPKQKSGWGVVVVIILIIVLAAALGAAAYFMLGLGV